jgi:hypothetical protein
VNAHTWHRIINDVARDMTAAAPAADFRMRVMEQVSATPPARLRPLRGLRRGATLAAAAAIATIAVSVAQPFRSSEPPRSMARVGTPSAPVVAPADPATTVEVPATAVRRTPAPRPSAALVEWRARNIPALADVAALELAHIQPAGLSISQLSVTPLDIAPIVVPSIPQIDDRR